MFSVFEHEDVCGPWSSRIVFSRVQLWTQVRMYYGSGTDERCYIYAGHTKRLLCMHSPDGSTFLCEITLWLPSWKCDVKLEIWLVNRCILTWRTNPAKFRPDPILNDRGLDIFEDSTPSDNKHNKMGSVPGPNKKLSYHRETARQLCTSFSARSMIVHFTEHRICCTTKL